MQGWDSMTKAFTGKFVYIALNSMLLRLNHFDVRVDMERWVFRNFVLWFA